jgi:peptide/nickel transport system substrate-binding protein
MTFDDTRSNSGTKRYSRRQIVAAVGGVGLSAWLAAACSDARSNQSAGATAPGVPTSSTVATPATASTAAAKPAADPSKVRAKGGTLRVGQVGDPTFVPNTPLSFGYTNHYLVYGVLEQLIRYRDQLQPELVLAETFEVDSNYTRAVARLKPSLTFHNGAPVTTDDVFFAVHFTANPEQYGGGPHLYSAQAKQIVDMKALDDRTMEFKFDQTRVNMADFFAQLQISQAAKIQDLLSGKDIQGTGPYKFVRWVPKQSMTFAANPNWHGTDKEGGPYLDGIELTIFGDEDARSLAYEAGNLDMITLAAPSFAAKYKGTPQAYTAPRIGTYYMGIPVDSPKLNPLLKDPRVRRAIFIAMDRKRLVEELLEGVSGGVTAQPWAKTSPAYDATLDAEYFDPDRAKSLLKDAGFSQSQPFTLEATPFYVGTGLPEVIQQNLADIGVNMKINVQDSPTYLTRWTNWEFTDLFMGVQSFGDLSPLSTLQLEFGPTKTPYKGHLDIMEKLATLDPSGAEARQQYQRFNKLYPQDAWHVPLWPFARPDLASTRVEGFGEYFITPLQCVNLAKVGFKAT